MITIYANLKTDLLLHFVFDTKVQIHLWIAVSVSYWLILPVAAMLVLAYLFFKIIILWVEAAAFFLS